MRKQIIFIICCMLLANMFYACKNKDVSDDKYIEFAKQIEQNIIEGNPEFLNQAFDYQIFYGYVLENMDLNEMQKAEAESYIKNNLRPGNTIVEAVINGADFHFVKFYRDENNQPKLVFRIYFNGGIVIEEWEVKAKKEQIVIQDVFSIVSGIKWSEDYRQRLNNYFNIVTEDVVNINRLIQVNMLVANEDYQIADSLLSYVLPSMQNYLYARVMEMNLASVLKDYEYVKDKANQFVKDFPSEERIAIFYSLQSAIGNGLIEEVNQHIEKLSIIVGNDPIYYVYRSWAFQRVEAYDYALQALDSVIANIPSLFDLYIEKMDIYYIQEQYDQLVKVLQFIDTLFIPNESDIDYFSKRYPKIVQNESFKIWKDQHTTKIVS